MSALSEFAKSQNRQKKRISHPFLSLKLNVAKPHPRQLILPAFAPAESCGRKRQPAQYRGNRRRFRNI